MPKKVDSRPQWEREDEGHEFHLHPIDRAVIVVGYRGAAVTGLLAGAVIGVLPWALVLLIRAAMHGGWHFDHWVWNMTIYAWGSVPLGAAMGALRRWSALGHRYHLVPMANVRAGWDTWLGILAIDLFVCEILIVDGVGLLLLFTIWGLMWLGLLYSMILSGVQNMFVRLLRDRQRPITSASV